MASSAFVDDQLLKTPVRSSSYAPFHINQGRSTAQARLERILHTILSGTGCVPGGSESTSLRPRKSEAEGFGIDFNLRQLLFEPQNLVTVGGSSGCSGVGGGEGDDVKVLRGLGLSSSVEFSNASTVEMSSETCGKEEEIAGAGREEGEEDKVEALEFSGVTNTSMVKKKGGDDSEEDRGNQYQQLVHGKICGANSEDERRKVRKLDDRSGSGSGGGYLHLLLEAVRHISGDFGTDKPTPLPPKNKKRRSPSDEAGKKGAEQIREARRSRDWVLEFYGGTFEGDTAPLVRSKRGRSQALPSRYRDTVLDPWRK